MRLNCKFYYKRVLLWMALLGAWGAAYAQGESQVRFQFRLLVIGKSDRGELYYQHGSSWEGIQMESLSLSDAFEYRGSRNFRLYRSSPAQMPNAAIAAEWEVDASGGEWLLLLVPAGGSGRYQIYPLPDGKDKLLGQNAFIVNLSSERIAGSLGGAAQVIEPGRYALVGHADGEKRARLRIKVAVQEGNKWRLLRSTSMPSRGRSQRWLIIYVGGRDGILIYPDFIN